MQLLNHMTIKSRMMVSIALLVLVFVIFGIVTLQQMRVLGELTTTLYNHPLPVSNAALKAKSGVVGMQRDLKDVSTSQTRLSITSSIQKIQSEEKAVYRELETIRERILGDEGKKLVQETIEMFAGWKPIRLEVEELVLAGNPSAANRITREKGAEYAARLERKMEELAAYAVTKADGFINDAGKVGDDIFRNTIGFILLSILVSTVIGFLMSASILASLTSLKDTMTRITETGELVTAELQGKNEITEMAAHFNGVIEKLRHQYWVGDGENLLSKRLSGNLTFDDIAKRSIEQTSRYVDACAGALYIYNEEESVCELKSSYALVESRHFADRFKPGEGIVGQVATEKKAILLRNIHKKDAIAQSGTIREPPEAIYVTPLEYEDIFYGVLEIASFEDITLRKQNFIQSAAGIISVILHAAAQNEEIKRLLDTAGETNETLQVQTEELQAQAVELRAMNEEYGQQSHELKAQNSELEIQRSQVEAANRLKSEFLSNMSHELRTPLNSVNALSRVLILQASDKLSEEEASYLSIIERNGKHLLSLINDILDLSKIEAGRMDVTLSRFSIESSIETVIEDLLPLAAEKGIRLTCSFAENLPRIKSDESRTFQILQNIIANGVKFTDQGSVQVHAETNGSQMVVRVKDTGIGIPDADIGSIFEEFRQVDGASTRKFGGTGLGLAIAHRTARMLGGDIGVESSTGIGSVFTVVLPIEYAGPKTDSEAVQTPTPRSPKTATDRKTILIVDDDPRILTMISRAFIEEDYRVLATTSGKEALKLAETHQPDAITLDVIMPDMDGWEVLSQLKINPSTATIPVIVVSVSDDKDTGFALGAVGYVTKPVRDRSLINEINRIHGYPPSSVMVVDDSEQDRNQTASIIREAGMRPILAEGGEQCLTRLRSESADVLVLDLVMPDMDGFKVLERIRANPATRNLPVIVATAKDLSLEEKRKLQDKVSSILVKSESTSGGLMEEIKDILSRLENKKRTAGEPTGNSKKKILLVEDNDAAVIQVRKALENIGIGVDVAGDGKEALDYIRHTLPEGIILDLMMPNVDGFQVLESIRSSKDTRDIPIIILTAKDLDDQDLKRLSSNSIQQLIQKGDVDRDELMDKVRLMLTDRPETRPESRSKIAAKADGRKLILAVEDNPDNMTTVRAVMGKKYSIAEAVDGEEGLEKAIELIPDLILLDISLPKKDGLSVANELKRNERTKHIPIIAITAQAMKGDKERIMDGGCDDYIAKPIDPETVLATLEKWL